MGTQNSINFGKWVLLTGSISILLGFGIFLHACDHVEATKERENMGAIQTNSNPNVAMPSIDRSAPLKIETATFALG